MQCEDVLKTLSCTRNIREMAAYSGISYSRVSGWVAQKKKKEELPPYIDFLLEYWMRHNPEEEKRLIQKYGLQGESGREEIGTWVMGTENYDAMKNSEVEWKRGLVDHFRRKPPELLEAQARLVDIFVASRNPEVPRKEENMEILDTIIAIDPTAGL